MYLLDTNVVIDFLDTSLSPPAMKAVGNIVDEQCTLSIITKMETLGFNFDDPSEQLSMELFINGSVILNISDEVVAKTIIIRKAKKIRLPDAVIAATAIVYDLTLLTRNVSDFNGIPELKIVNTGTISG